MNISPDIINSEIDKVLSKLFERIEKLEKDTLENYKTVIKKKLESPHNTLFEKSYLAWHELKEDSLDFAFYNDSIRKLNSITLKDVKSFFAETFIGQPKKLSIRIFPSTIPYNKKIEHEKYGILNNRLKSAVYYKTHFLEKAKEVAK